MEPVTSWTGQTACALQAALRLTNEAVAEHLGVSVRTVASWHQRPEMVPGAAIQQILDTALEQASTEETRRFNQLTSTEVDDTTLADAERKLNGDPHIGKSLDWLDRRAGWVPGTARRKVVELVATADAGEIEDRRRRRIQVKQADVADALATYYNKREGFGTYRGTCDSTPLATTILTQPQWLDLETELTAESDRVRLDGSAASEPPKLDEFAAQLVASRLADAIAMETRIYDLPLYQLLEIDIRPGALDGVFGLNTFVEYALTLDLLEGELVDALAAEAPSTPRHLALRDRYLPDVDSVLNVSERLCAGGTLAMFAIARPASAHQPLDYLILVQERSGHVLNSPRRLSLTQGFHQPMIDYRVETRIALTLMRELEEEMFGREDLDNTVTDSRRADPMHPSRLTRPMRWLTKSPGRLRVEATGFGLNLVNGNYEFANLIVVEDTRFWDKFGGHIEANWEAGSLRRYSTQDRELLAELIRDPNWTNEGLFTLHLGLRRLATIGPDRVNLPELTWTLD